MCDQDLPTSLWEEASSTTVYIQDRCHHAILDQKTPKEVFIDEKLGVGHLRIFSFPVYIHVSKEKRTKMEPSRNKGIFVGYSETSKAYIKYSFLWTKSKKIMKINKRKIKRKKK